MNKTIFIIILIVAQTVSGNCFCGKQNDENRVFSFSQESKHGSSLAVSFFESMASRFNAFGLRDPTYGVKLSLSKAQSLNFKGSEVRLLYSLNNLLYFELSILVDRDNETKEPRLTVGLREVIQETTSLKNPIPTTTKNTFTLTERTIENKLCSLFVAFVEAMVVRQFGFSVVDGLTVSKQCLPVRATYTYNLPRYTAARTLVSLPQRRRRNRVLLESSVRNEFLTNLLKSELELAALFNEVDEMTDQINQLFEHLDVVKMGGSRNSDILRIEESLIEKVVRQHEATKAQMKLQMEVSNRIIADFSSKIKSQPMSQRDDDVVFLERVVSSLRDNTFLSIFGNTESRSQLQSERRPIATELLSDFVQRDVSFPSTGFLKWDLSETQKLATKAVQDESASKGTVDEEMRRVMRDSLEEQREQLANKALIPDIEEVTETIAKSESEAVDLINDDIIKVFRKESLEELGSQLESMERPINKAGKTAIIRGGMPDVEPQFDGGLKVEPNRAAESFEEDDWFGDEQSRTVFVEQVNDVQATEEELRKAEHQPCDRVFERVPLFLWDSFLSKQPQLIRPVSAFIEMSRERRVSLSEDIKLKVIYDSQVEGLLDGRLKEGFDGTIVRRINLMNEKLPQTRRKLKELQNWIINVVEAVQRSSELRDLKPHIRVYSDYSVYFKFERMSRSESLAKLATFLPREEQSELEVVVEMTGTSERHSLLAKTSKVSLGSRERSTEGQAELDQLVGQIHELSGF